MKCLLFISYEGYTIAAQHLQHLVKMVFARLPTVKLLFFSFSYYILGKQATKSSPPSRRKEWKLSSISCRGGLVTDISWNFTVRKICLFPPFYLFVQSFIYISVVYLSGFSRETEPTQEDIYICLSVCIYVCIRRNWFTQIRRLRISKMCKLETQWYSSSPSLKF